MREFGSTTSRGMEKLCEPGKMRKQTFEKFYRRLSENVILPRKKTVTIRRPSPENNQSSHAIRPAMFPMP